MKHIKQAPVDTIYFFLTLSRKYVYWKRLEIQFNTFKILLLYPVCALRKRFLWAYPMTKRFSTNPPTLKKKKEKNHPNIFSKNKPFWNRNFNRIRCFKDLILVLRLYALHQLLKRTNPVCIKLIDWLDTV